jgi:hypothetical protein
MRLATLILSLPISARQRPCLTGSDGPSLAQSRGCPAVVLALVACATSPLPGLSHNPDT